MKISLVTPVYNEEKSLERYFRALQKIDYSRGDLELVMVNDGSSDNSLEMMEEWRKKLDFEVKVINLEKNAGWLVARETGAKQAKYDNLLFIDCKCEIFPDALKALKECDYRPVNFQVIQWNDHVFDRFFYLLRKKYYKNLIGESDYDVEINSENFDAFPKGTTCLFVDKQLFLDSQPRNKNSKLVNDDIRLLRNMVEVKPLRNSSKFRVYYNTRKGLSSNLRHMYSRGPRFADYYYKPSHKWFWVINFALISAFVLVYLMFRHSLFVEVLGGLLVMDVIVALFFAEGLKDFFIFLLLFPLISIFFFVGVVKGLLWKVFVKKVVGDGTND